MKHSNIRDAQGFTLIKLLIVIAILAVGAAIGAAVLAKKAQQASARGAFTRAPSTISLSPPRFGQDEFVWTVTTSAAVSAAGRRTSFVVAGPRARIMAITDRQGFMRTIPNGTNSTTTNTDGSGVVKLLVKIDSLESETLTGTDSDSGNSNAVTFRGVK